MGDINKHSFRIQNKKIRKVDQQITPTPDSKTHAVR